MIKSIVNTTTKQPLPLIDWINILDSASNSFLFSVLVIKYTTVHNNTINLLQIQTCISII